MKLIMIWSLINFFMFAFFRKKKQWFVLFTFSAQQAIQEQQMMEKMIGQQIPVNSHSLHNSLKLILQNLFCTIFQMKFIIIQNYIVFMLSKKLSRKKKFLQRNNGTIPIELN